MTRIDQDMTASQERGAWSTSGYLMLILFLALPGLTVWRIIAIAGGQPDDSEVFRFVVGTGLTVLALAMLSEKGVVHLDDERKAAMVSNLMVVLCSERDTQPVVNAGTLYQ